ncbi:MAG: hydroxyisourate hydrolase [Aestuariivita sp.]|nr:hydroxyisourate hydrolase [Aestuariivita sp.]
MAKGFLTTHVLDTSLGIPAVGLSISLYRLDSGSQTKISQMITNNDGRTETPILPESQFKLGCYELFFYAGAYFDSMDIRSGMPRFLDEIPIRFGISEINSHYHVPLLLSPFGYSTYRGS